MPEIRHQQLSSAPEILSSEIHIPDDSDWGTGTFTTNFSPSSLPPKRAIVASMINSPRFQITATLNANRDMPVLIGSADEPRNKAMLLLPDHIKQSVGHQLVIQFSAWQIRSATFDGKTLEFAGAGPQFH